ncbi:hypothetical protein EX30DRAFT_261013 [Ascodesmis nigricans]|uniref:Uncharacterized protein n=1 Tax=Ascodesmis nigricans TaxID=341454 RepID=A0A4S2MXP2_9PEZI|nr:hypothetical protein EX30DRAFT_261013 [Ascodesmis nigricans]
MTLPSPSVHHLHQQPQHPTTLRSQPYAFSPITITPSHCFPSRHHRSPPSAPSRPSARRELGP